MVSHYLKPETYVASILASNALIKETSYHQLSPVRAVAIAVEGGAIIVWNLFLNASKLASQLFVF